MLQLPQTGTTRRLPVRAMPARKAKVSATTSVQDTSCTVATLAIEYTMLIRAYDRADRKDDKFEMGRAMEGMLEIAERASHFVATSKEGAAFQLMLASSAGGSITDGSTPQIKEMAEQRQERLFYRLLDYIDGADAAAIPRIRQYHMPAGLDPAHDRRPTRR